MGCFCPWANAKGAFIGGSLSLILSSWLSLGSAFSKKIKREPWLPSASVDQCIANQNASLFNNMTTPSGLSVGDFYGLSTQAMWNASFSEFDGVYGFQFDATDHYYSTAASSVVMQDTTTVAVPEYVPQGVEVMYTMSYQWLAPVGIFATIILGSIISVMTGRNKEREVHPRYLISFCDHMCCFLPECIRRPFRCGDDYTSVKDDDFPPVHDLFLDKEQIISPPPIITITKEPSANGDSVSMTLMTEREGQPLAGNDVNLAHDGGDEGEDGHMTHSTSAEDNGNVPNHAADLSEAQREEQVVDEQGAKVNGENVLHLENKESAE